MLTLWVTQDKYFSIYQFHEKELIVSETKFKERFHPLFLTEPH